jgi:hypothetical protein
LDFEFFFDPFLNKELDEWIGGTLPDWTVRNNPGIK